MNTKHILGRYIDDMTAAHCMWCGMNTPIVRKAKKYYCANDPDIPNAPKKELDRISARHKAFTMKAHRLENTYSLTYYQYLWLLDECDYACPLCLQPFTKESPPHIDHDHSCCPDKISCGQCIRGLLCRMCNGGLGYFKDSPDALLRAFEYLARP